MGFNRRWRARGSCSKYAVFTLHAPGGNTGYNRGCFGSDKERPAKPEEIVRQLFIKKLLDNYGYPKERIQVEKDVWFGSGVSDKRADIVVLQKDLEYPFIIVEVKKPNRKDGIEQLKSYCNAEGSPIGVWTNGSELVILHREEPNIFSHISKLPSVNEKLMDVLRKQHDL